MKNTYLRTEMLLGAENLRKLQNSRVLVFGLGGVGGFAVEALARTGVGALDLVDNDVVSPSNLNRQIIATRDTIGQPKTEAMAGRVAVIAPDCRVTAHQLFYLPGGPDLMEDVDYVIDAVDTVTAKLAIIQSAQEKGIPVISAMGTGNKLDPGRLCVTDIYQTRGCPLAKVMRQELRKRGVKALRVVYSPEEPMPARLTPEELAERGEPAKGRATPGSAIFVPATAGLLLASAVVRELIGKEEAHG